MDGKPPRFIALDNTIGNLGVLAHVPAIGQQARHVSAGPDSLGDGGGVRVRSELRRVVVLVWGGGL